MSDVFRIVLVMLAAVALLCVGWRWLSLWGYGVVGAAWWVAIGVEWVTVRVLRRFVRSPAFEASWWRSVTLLGVVAGASLAYWVHASLFGPWVQRQLLHALTPVSGVPEDGLWLRVASVQAGTSGAPLLSAASAVMLFVILFPSLGFGLALVSGLNRQPSPVEVRNQASYAGCALAICLIVHAVLWYSPLGPIWVDWLNTIMRTWTYVGISIGLVTLVSLKTHGLPRKNTRTREEE